MEYCLPSFAQNLKIQSVLWDPHHVQANKDYPQPFLICLTVESNTLILLKRYNECGHTTRVALAGMQNTEHYSVEK